jgi:hypothetical protein
MSASSPELQPIPPQAVVTQMAMSFIVSQALGVAAKLKIADLLNDGAKNAEEIAALTQTHAPSVYRLMRALSSVGAFKSDAENRFSNTPLGDVLRSDHSDSIRGAVHMITDPEHWRPHGNMLQSVKTGEIAFDYTFGMPVFPYFAENPQAAEVFDNAMTSFGLTIAKAVADTYDFSEAETIADIGGGHGNLLATVLKTNRNSAPQAKGILFDQPQVIRTKYFRTRRRRRPHRNSQRRFFRGNSRRGGRVPDEIHHPRLERRTVRNDSEKSGKFRQTGREASTSSKRSSRTTPTQPSMSKVMDLNMLVMTGGKERTEKRIRRDCFEKSGI